jgi:serine/threonine-protein kinase
LSLEATHLDLNKRPGGAPAPGPAEPETLPPGVRSLGGYRLLRKLGEGGMGAVFLAYQQEGDRQVAVKVLADALAASQPYVERFYREARSGSVLSHVNIVRNLAAGKDRASGLHYLVLEYVDGPSARELLESQGKLAVGDAVHVALDIARALEHAHSRNVIHRDIKPDNILITRSGVAKLTDLGLAKRTDEASHLTATRQGFGTPYYMPYEQAMNAKYADGRSDIYALGATLYHLLTGQVPFSGANHVEIVEKKNLGSYPPAQSVNAEVPPALEGMLARMLAREPEERYQTASELIIDLERSGLAAVVPSFVDRAVALQDPVVRRQLNAPSEPTQLDLNAQPKAAGEDEARPGVWFLRYRDRRGQWCKARTTTEQVIKRLGDGRLPVDAEAGTQVQGPFQPLSAFPEFHAALATAGTKRRRRRSSRAPAEPEPPPLPPWLLLSVTGLVLTILVVAAAVFWHW